MADALQTLAVGDYEAPPPSYAEAMTIARIRPAMSSHDMSAVDIGAIGVSANDNGCAGRSDPIAGGCPALDTGGVSINNGADPHGERIVVNAPNDAHRGLVDIKDFFLAPYIDVVSDSSVEQSITLLKEHIDKMCATVRVQRAHLYNAEKRNREQEEELHAIRHEAESKRQRSHQQRPRRKSKIKRRRISTGDTINNDSMPDVSASS
jgi:hypothetical protein